MPNPQYLAGRRLEYEVMAEMREKGYKVLRTAGSHGDYDLVAYKTNSTVFIQCKRVSTKAEMERMLKAWTSSPPEPPGTVNFSQQLSVRVKGASKTESAIV